WLQPVQAGHGCRRSGNSRPRRRRGLGRGIRGRGMMDGVSVFCDHICQLGEGPSYDPGTDALFWFDIVNGLLLEKGVTSGALKIHELGLMASAIAIIDDQRQLVATETGLQIRD